jgi:hypothetical protein
VKVVQVMVMTPASAIGGFSWLYMGDNASGVVLEALLGSGNAVASSDHRATARDAS